jgi:hypothetical protein
MARVSFTPALQRFLSAPPVEVEGASLREALAAVFAARPELRSYLLDDQGALRRHVAVYVNGAPARDRLGDVLADALKARDPRLSGPVGRLRKQEGA